MPEDQPVLVPGAPDAPQDQSDTTAQAAPDAPAEPTIEMAEPEIVPQELVTPHGNAALAASDFRSMTTTQLHAKVQAGEIDLGHRQNVLCADGYYCNPNLS